MKKYEGDGYNTLSLSGHSRLVVYGTTVEEIRKEIDESNLRAVAAGWKPQQWVITHREWRKYVDDNGHFLKSEEIETKIEIYPATLPAEEGGES